MSASSIIIAAPASGAGKTIVATAIIAALRRRGLAVAAFKVGPDYIDPAFLSHAAGRPAVNLDSWAMRFETLAGLLQEAGQGADILIGEGVMGLFDGARDGTGSTADLAALFGLPVVLVVDARAMGQSVAALVDGFHRHRDDVDVAGVVFNRTSGRAHAELLRRACYEHVSTPVLGALDHDPALALPSRHLGLVQAGEQAGLDAVIRRAADQVERSLDLDRLQRLSRSPSVSLLGPAARPLPPLGARIAVAQDAAFAFTYPAVLNGWRRQGAELSLFSPLADEVPEPGCDAVFLPGGYPELHGATLAGATRFQDGLRAAAARGAAIYGECGGYMVLGRQLVDADGCGHTDDRPPAGDHELRNSRPAARLPPDRASGGRALGPAWGGLSRSRVPLRARGRAGRAGLVPGGRRGWCAPARAGLPCRPCHGLVPPPHRSRGAR